MEQKLTCDTVRDLFPIYIDKLTSETTNQSIEDHLKDCGDCRMVLDQMNSQTEVETAPEVQNLKKFLNKSKKKLAIMIIEILSVIGILTCFIVDLAVSSGKLSWSLIVDGSIISLVCIIYTALTAKNNKFIKTAAVTNFCTFFLLGLIQAVLYNRMDLSDLWFWDIGLPITLLWSAVLWISMFCSRFLKTNVVLSIAIFLLLSVPANGLTNIIGGAYRTWREYFANYISNGLGLTLAGIVLLVIGI